MTTERESLDRAWDDLAGKLHEWVRFMPGLDRDDLDITPENINDEVERLLVNGDSNLLELRSRLAISFVAIRELKYREALAEREVSVA